MKRKVNMKCFRITDVLFIACLVLLFLITGCAGQKQETPATAGQKEAQAEKTWVVGYSQESLTHPWLVTQKKLVMEAAKKYNIKVIATDGQDKIEKQVSDIEDLMAQGVDLIMVQAAKAEGLKPVLKKVHEKGIPFIFVGKPVFGTDAISMVAADNYDIGKKAGEYIVQRLGGKGNVVILEGIPGDETSRDRVQGALDVFKNYPGIKVVAQQPAWYRRNTGREVMQNILQAQRKIDCVYACEDEQALGAITSIKEAGRMKEMFVVGVNGQMTALEAIKAGDMAATLLYPTAGTEGVELALKVLRGEEVPPRIIVPTALITKENVDEYIKLNPIGY